MRVIHIVHGKANPDGHNGISGVVYNLNKQERLLGVESEIWALVDGCRSHATYVRDQFVTIECFPRVRLPFGRHQIIKRLLAERGAIDIVHFHLIWCYDKNIIAKALVAAGIPFVITTHGTYTKPHAYTGKRWLARILYERRFLNMADEVHILTREEGTGLQKYGYEGPVFVAPNGVDVDRMPPDLGQDFFGTKPYSKKIKAIWVGVLRDDKNLPALIRSLALVSQADRDKLMLILVGPDYRGNKGRYERLAEGLGVRDCLDFTGPLYGDEKFRAIRSADIYVMPSHTEGMSLAVLDALACGKPSVMTMGCGFNYFLAEGFFVACEPYPSDLARGLEELIRNQLGWPDMGRRAKSLVEKSFAWPTIARQMVENYGRICKGAR